MYQIFSKNIINLYVLYLGLFKKHYYNFSYGYEMLLSLMLTTSGKSIYNLKITFLSSDFQFPSL